MTHLDKLKVLIESGNRESINQALELAGALFDKNSKEMRMVRTLVNDVKKALSEISLEGNLLEESSNQLRLLSKSGISLVVYLSTYLRAIRYKDFSVVYELELDWDWSSPIEAFIDEGFVSEEMELSEENLKLLERGLGATLPVSKKFAIAVSDLDSRDEKALSVIESLLSLLERKLQKVADKVSPYRF